MTGREWTAVKAAVTIARHELGAKATGVGPGAYTLGRRADERVTLDEVREIRAYVRAAVAGDTAAMRRFGASS